MKMNNWFKKNALGCLLAAILFAIILKILRIVLPSIALIGVVLYIMIFPEKKPEPYISIRDKSGLKHIYNLSDFPDVITFTIWEKEPGMYGSEVLIIPGEHRTNEAPKGSYIKTKFSTDKPILYFYHYIKYSSNKQRFDKNTIFLRSDKDSTFNKGLYEIIIVQDSEWDIFFYSDSLYNAIYFNDSVSKILRTDLSLFSVDIDERFAEYQLAGGINFCLK